MTIGSLFSGIGGLELGLERAGLGPTIWQVECDPKARIVLEKHWPHAERWPDVHFVGAAQLAPVDLICGGFPCQDLSAAGKRAGIERGHRSGLWREFRRIIGELRPSWVVIENVHHTWRRWVPIVRSDLGRLRYASVPLCVRASDLGAWHRRGRIFIIAYSDDIRTRQYRRRSGPRRSDSTQSSIARAVGIASDFACQQKRESHDAATAIGGEQWWQAWSVFGGGAWRSSEPAVERVVYGLPSQLDRIRLLGNAVCPPVAEAVGHFVKAMMEDQQ